MLTNNILNIDNKPFVNNVYHIEIGPFRNIDVVVFANDAQEALDITIDYYEENRSDYEGFFFSEEELLEEGHLGDYLSGGNCGTYLTFTVDEVCIREYHTSDITLYIELKEGIL